MQAYHCDRLAGPPPVANLCQRENSKISTLSLNHTLQDLGRQINILTAIFHEFEVQFQHEFEKAGVRNSCDTDMWLPQESIDDNTWQTPRSDPNGKAVLGPKTSPRPSLNDFPTASMSSMMSQWWNKDDQTLRYHLAPPTVAGTHLAPPTIAETQTRVRDPESGFFQALLDGDLVEVQYQLEACGEDPNLPFCDVTVCSKRFAVASPLAVAVLTGNSNMVQMLAAHGALLGSTYSFMAGAEQQIWEGPVTHAAVPSGNLALLSDLVELKADVNAQGSNDANLAWQSAYFGHVAIMNYLVKAGVALSVKARSQDDSRIQHTPLHAAVVAGHLAMVTTLLRARAEPLTDDGRGRAPLYDAVRFGNSDMVKHLIESKGNPFSKKHTPNLLASKTLSSLCEGSAPPSCLARAFESRNEVLLTKIAEGLKSVPALLADMSRDDFLHFLTSPGEASIHAMEAVFQPYVLRYWHKVDGKLFRRVPRQAYLDTESRMNFMDGPHIHVLTDLFNSREPLPSGVANFVDKLLPQERWSHGHSCHVPVVAYMCHIRGVHKDLRVLLALADCPNSKIYTTNGCCVIINQKWESEKKMARFRLGILGIEVFNFVFINYITDESRRETSGSVDLPLLNWAIAVSLVSWSASTFLEVAQVVGYLSENLGRRYAANPRHLFDVFVSILTGAVSIALLFMPVEQSDDYRFCTAFGVLVSLKWIRFLTSFAQVKDIGIKILPISETMLRIFPFLGVLSIYLIATVNLFYSLKNGHGWTECLLLMYRLVVLGDMDLAELENQIAPPLAVNLSTGITTQAESAPTDYFYVVRILMVAASFVIGVAMMNLFVAMLCLEYSQAYEQAEQTFMNFRANIVLDQHAVRRGAARLFCSRRRHGDHDPTLSWTSRAFRQLPGMNQHRASDSDVPSSSAFGQLPEDFKGYLWFAQQAALNDE